MKIIPNLKGQKYNLALKKTVKTVINFITKTLLTDILMNNIGVNK